jgi:hypothetical protein
MDDRLSAACGEFEQVVISDFLRPAVAARSASDDASANGDGDDTIGRAESSDAFSQLVTDALARGIERAGGFGLRAALVHSLGGFRSDAR